MLFTAVPGLLTVSVRALLALPAVWLPKSTLLGVNLIFGTPIPLPASETLCGEPGALSVRVSVAARAPPAVGLKATLNVHVSPAATLAQDPDFLKSPGWSPAIELALIVSVPVPVFVIVTVWAAL